MYVHITEELTLHSRTHQTALHWPEHQHNRDYTSIHSHDTHTPSDTHQFCLSPVQQGGALASMHSAEEDLDSAHYTTSWTREDRNAEEVVPISPWSSLALAYTLLMIVGAV